MPLCGNMSSTSCLMFYAVWDKLNQLITYNCHNIPLQLKLCVGTIIALVIFIKNVKDLELENTNSYELKLASGGGRVL